MIIDSHQHFWNYNRKRNTWINESMEILKKDFLPHDLEPILKQNKIDGCITVQADQYYLKQVSQYENKITFKENYELPELAEDDQQAVTIEVTAGYANGDIPENMKIALLMLATTLDSNRESGPYYGHNSVKDYLQIFKRY